MMLLLVLGWLLVVLSTSLERRSHSGVERGAVVVPVRWQEGLRCVLLTVSTRSRLRVLGVNPLHEVQCKDLRMGTVQGIYFWGSALEMEI